MSEKKRIIHFDILRGLAISLMIMANCAGSTYTAVPPLFMRTIGSFAAPCFMILAGMMLALTTKPKPLRGLYVMLLAGVIDVVIWRNMPFMTFDVLYAIGAAIFITAYPARYFSIRTLWFGGILFFGMGQGLQWTLGYSFKLFEFTLNLPTPMPPLSEILTHVTHQFFIDGWFPLFPWLGFVWLGAALQRSLNAQTEGARSAFDNSLLMPRRWMMYATGAFILAAGYWSYTFVVPEPRMGYSELFYAPTAGFCFTAASVFGIVLFIIQTLTHWQPARFILAPLNSLGQRSLWIYVFHYTVIKFVITPYFSTADYPTFLFNALMLWGCCVLLARALIAYTYFNTKKKAAALALHQSI